MRACRHTFSSTIWRPPKMSRCCAGGMPSCSSTRSCGMKGRRVRGMGWGGVGRWRRERSVGTFAAIKMRLASHQRALRSEHTLMRSILLSGSISNSISFPVSVFTLINIVRCETFALCHCKEEGCVCVCVAIKGGGDRNTRGIWGYGGPFVAEGLLVIFSISAGAAAGCFEDIPCWSMCVCGGGG